MTATVLPPSIEAAELSWQDGVPESARFGDIYFSRDNGLAESRYVFLDHNRLPERFRQVPPGGHFVVAESGFGTGLNFLAAWQAWREHQPDHPATLHFVSVERFPLRRDDLSQALSHWPELAPYAEALLSQYPPLTRGVHRLVFDGGRVRLTLYFGDIVEAWQALAFTADAWFLDGFAPASNPGMWLDETMAQIKAHSGPGTTLATFTSVGRVRRALADAGFDMRKTRGFGRKREMLTGTLPTPAIPDDAPASTGDGADTPKPSTLIVGAGIAGCLLAHNLAQRGFPVTLVDSAAHPGAGASGNRQGATYVKLGVEFNDQTELALTALTFSHRFYQPYRDQGWYPTGLLQLAWNAKEQERQHKFLERNDYPEEVLFPVDPDHARALTGLQVQTGGLWFPGSGWLEPARLCATLCQHPLIDSAFRVQVDRLTNQGPWRAVASDGRSFTADRVVICGGHRSPALLPDGDGYRFKAIRGQVTHLEEAKVQAPDAVICGARYLNPAHGGQALTGATFDLRDDNPTPTRASHEQNLTELDAMVPGVVAPNAETLDRCDGRVAFRCTTHDYLPVTDGVDDADGAPVPGLYLMTGLGSKGLSYAPVLAEFLADRLTGQPGCLPERLVRRLASGRLRAGRPATSKSEKTTET